MIFCAFFHLFFLLTANKNHYFYGLLWLICFYFYCYEMRLWKICYLLFFCSIIGRPGFCLLNLLRKFPCIRGLGPEMNRNIYVFLSLSKASLLKLLGICHVCVCLSHFWKFKSDNIASNWIKLNIWFKSDKIGSVWFKLDQIGSNWIKLVQNDWLDLFEEKR